MEDLALYAGGDLDVSDIEELDTHIASCEECSATVEDLRADRALFAAIPELPETAIAELHERVISRLQTPRRYAWPAAIAACIAAAAVIATQAGSYKEPPPPPPLKQLAMRIPEAPQPLQIKKTHRVQPRKSQRASDAALIAAIDNLFEPEPHPVAPISGPVVITMQTQDPNVTIILLPESKGETE
jgi:anti-sigma factor RsiW